MVSDAVSRLQRENAVLVPVDRAVEPEDWLLLETVAQPADPDADESAGSDTSTPDAADVATADPSADASADAVADSGTDSGADASTFPVALATAGEELRSQLVGATIGQTVAVALPDEVVTDESGEPTTRTLYLKVHDIKGKEKPQPGDEFATQ